MEVFDQFDVFELAEVSVCGFYAFETGLQGVSFCTPGGFFFEEELVGFFEIGEFAFCVCEIGGLFCG